ncbi:DNA-binding response regulator [Mycetocola tolaasinivorans]|uniref:DNA-binding response regulator n=1 Tax=Mycetocola tolaasinivorans TaxID=76635 RepID=A0A3L7A2T4_9MICO|nr:response regulator transcription factor [Mycetocola tolaasinivorans]RLP74487.1 DNA-binding response regulator [Mycetocola tolaasinivorans]
MSDSSSFRPAVPLSAMTRADGGALRILVVDDEPALTDLLRMALRYEGWEVETAGNGANALATARRFNPDLVILDIMLPDLDGLSILARLRARDADLPVLFLTAKDALDDRIAGLTAGGDDYVTKPFSLEELVARIRGLLRRAALVTPEQIGPIVQVGDLILNEDSHEVERGGDPIDLTATEFELLRYLMRNPRRLLSKMQILDRVWNYEFDGRTSIVELYISYLRRKIDAGREPMIHTSRGVGYMIKPARVSAE